MSAMHSQVVVAFDFSHSGRAALYRGIGLAARAPYHVLHFVCVIEPHTPIAAVHLKGPVDYSYAEKIQGLVREEVELELKGANVAGQIHFYVHARIGKPAHEILEVAKDVGADLIIVGSKGATGLERLVLGSVSEHVVREAKCTVEVARPKTYEYVDLVEVVDVEPHHDGYVRPHRYSYDGHRVDVRPREWPLY